jgi:hypothetical protein
MTLDQIKNHLALACLICLLPANGILSILNAHYTVPFYGLLRSSALVFFFVLLLVMIQTAARDLKSVGYRQFIITSLFATMVGIMVFVTAQHLGIADELIDKLGRNAVYENFEVLFKYVLYFLIGVHLVHSEDTKKLACFLLVAMIGLILLKVNYSSFSLNLGAGSSKINYLFLGDVFAFWSIFTINHMKNMQNIAIVMLITLVTAYLIGSRTVFFLLFSVYTVILYAYTKNGYILTVFGLSILLLLVLVYGGSSSLSNSRMLSLLLLEDASLESRSGLLTDGMVDIRENWLYGRFAAPVIDEGNFGKYIHNHLSMWRQFGVIPFVISLILFFMLGKRIVTNIVNYDRSLHSNHQIMLATLALFLLLEMILARSYAYPYIWACVGMLCGSEVHHGYQQQHVGLGYNSQGIPNQRQIEHY